MKTTVFYRCEKRSKPRHINFLMRDVFNEYAISKEAKKVVRERFPYILDKIVRIEWEY